MIAAGRLDHVSPTRSTGFPVGMTSRADGTTEWATVEYAVNRLQGYYNEDEPWIEAALRAGTPLQTVSYIYRIAQGE